MMMSRSDGQDVLRCIEFGASDFITEPFVYRELALRIRAILARVDGSAREELTTSLTLGDLRLQPATNEVTRGSVEIHLTPTEFRIFFALVQSANHVVPAHRLLTYVWGSRGATASSLRSHICHLRTKLTLDGDARGSISSVPAVGYVFRAPAAREVHAASPLVAEGVAAGT